MYVYQYIQDGSILEINKYDMKNFIAYVTHTHKRIYIYIYKKAHYSWDIDFVRHIRTFTILLPKKVFWIKNKIKCDIEPKQRENIDK